MSTKLYNQKDLVINEISVAEFDALEGNHVFSDEYEKKKRSILNAFQDTQMKAAKKTGWKTAVAALAIFLISGTALAFSGDYLRALYEATDVKVEDEYLYDDFINAEYNMPVEITTDGPEDLFEFEVLQAAKGEHTISYAILVTINDPGMRNTENTHRWFSELTIPGYEDIVYNLEGGEAYNDWDYENKMGLAYNQTIEFVEYSVDENVDLNQIDTIEVTFSNLYEELWSEFIENENTSGDLKWRLIDDKHTWKVTIPLQDQYVDYSFDIQQTYNIYDNKFKIDTIRLTPMGISFCYELLGEENENLYIVSGGYFNRYEQDMSFLMHDGKKIKFEGLLQGGQMYHMNEDGTMEYERLDFSVPIDVEQVAGLEIDGERIELKR